VTTTVTAITTQAGTGGSSSGVGATSGGRRTGKSEFGWMLVVVLVGGFVG